MDIIKLLTLFPANWMLLLAVLPRVASVITETIRLFTSVHLRSFGSSGRVDSVLKRTDSSRPNDSYKEHTHVRTTLDTGSVSVIWMPHFSLHIRIE